jgi:hypothetical protein
MAAVLASMKPAVHEAGGDAPWVEATQRLSRHEDVTLPLPFSRMAEGVAMSKGMERKKEQKKKPAKTLEEKRAAKKGKKGAR